MNLIHKILWWELVQTKHNKCYFIMYTGYQRRKSKAATVIIAIFSTGGVIGWPFWNNIAFVTSIVVCAISLLTLLVPHFIPNEAEVAKMELVNDFYFKYYNDLESLWMTYDEGGLCNADCQAAYYKLKETKVKTNNIIDSLHRSVIKKIQDKAEEEAREYFHINFNT
jgi:hypothetical protein